MHHCYDDWESVHCSLSFVSLFSLVGVFGRNEMHILYDGMQTVRFKNELERNITIKLGYANAKIYKCEDERCPRPMAYK